MLDITFDIDVKIYCLYTSLFLLVYLQQPLASTEGYKPYIVYNNTIVYINNRRKRCPNIRISRSCEIELKHLPILPHNYIRIHIPFGLFSIHLIS